MMLDKRDKSGSIALNRAHNRFINSVAIAYSIVTTVTFVNLAILDPKLPMAFLNALVSPKFWSLGGTSFVIFMGVMLTVLSSAYIGAVLKPTRGIGIWQGILSGIVCALFYFCVFFMLMLSGLRH